jgi:hypothetical protein
MQYVLLVWVVGVFSVVVIMFRRFQRRASLRLPTAVTASALPLARYGGAGARWTWASASAHAGGIPGLGVTLFPWGVRFGTTSGLVGWIVPTIELTYSEVHADAVRSKLRSEGVRLRSTTDPQRSVILWTSQWGQVLDALAYNGVRVEKEVHRLDWTYQ